MEYLIEPWAHQRSAIERGIVRKNFALFFQMGAGKTSTAINILRHKFNAKRAILRTLIFCPPIVVENWRQEWLKNSKIDPRLIVPLTGSGKKRLRDFQTRAEAGPFIAITNYEALLMGDLYEAFTEWQPEAIIFDESHKVKDPKSRRSKLSEKLANPRDTLEPPPDKLILTGSPVLNSPMDLYMQYLVLDGGETFGTNFFIFRAQYFRDRNAGMPRDKYFPDWVLRPQAVEEINHLLSKTSVRVEKKDCLDLPPLVQQSLQVPLDPRARRHYEEMKRDFITYMEKGEAVVATMAMTKALRLMQISSGFVKTADGEEISLGKTPKQEALKELLSELTPNHKVLVWAVWKNNYEQIRQVCEELGIVYVEVHGDITPAQKLANIERFTSDPTCRVFLGHPGSGGIGCNLVVASYSIFYSRTFSLEQSLQAEARNHRGGSKEQGHEKITRIDLVSEGTIDELVLERLVNKQEISDRVLKDLALDLKKPVVLDRDSE